MGKKNGLGFCRGNQDNANFKGLLHPKIKILSLITYPYVVPNP